MKSDADTIRSFLLELLEHFSRTDFSPSGKVDDAYGTPSKVEGSPETARYTRSTSDYSSNLPAGEASSASIHDTSTKMPPLSQFGELPSVQDHFQAVLKRRLQTEISKNPPLFPWESGLQEYPAELSEIATFPWLAQLRSLRLPTVLPEDILAGLLSRCQSLIAESLQPGIQLVKAVETLFPDQPQVMDQIAGLVLANATVRSTATRDVESLKAAFPEGYEGANPQQQVTLAMLAAKDILDILSVTLSPTCPVACREWQSTAGPVILNAQSQFGTPSQINLTVDLPKAGRLSLPTTGQVVTRNDAGTLVLTLLEPKTDVVYPLMVHLDESDSEPLTFAIRWIDAN